jgi:pyruvate,orthophosphate dikinase
MIPLVGHVKELALQTEVVRRIAKEVMAETGTRFRYLVGTMIEVPRGALTADAIAGVAEFFSFGTNDLTQTTLGVSRDDAARFLGPYVDQFEIYTRDPFQTIDQGGLRLVAPPLFRGLATIRIVHRRGDGTGDTIILPEARVRPRPLANYGQSSRAVR